MKKSLALVAVSMFATSALFAAGFEKNVLWSGHYQGFGGAAASSVNNSEALLFNPAGLANLVGSGDIRLNFSPTFSTFKGPVSSTQSSKQSDTGFSPVAAITHAHKINDKLVVGVGAFVSGGVNAEFHGIDQGALTDGMAQSSLRIIDFTVGAATHVTEKFSLGLAWRLTYATADLATVIPSPVQAQLKYKNLKTLDYSSFRVGAQYRDENYGVGLNVRTPVAMVLKGDVEVSKSTVPSLDAKFSGATASATFPFQIALGGDYKLAPKWKLFTEVSWSNYSSNQKLDFNDASHGGNALIAGAGASDITLKWHDQWVGRLGAEWQAFEKIALRAGYVLTSQVTSSKFAKATFSSPGLGHTFTAGAGTKFGAWDADLAADYSFASGKGDANGAAPAGDFSSHSYTVHAGVAYNF